MNSKTLILSAVALTLFCMMVAPAADAATWPPQPQCPYGSLSGPCWYPCGFDQYCFCSGIWVYYTCV